MPRRAGLRWVTRLLCALVAGGAGAGVEAAAGARDDGVIGAPLCAQTGAAIARTAAIATPFMRCFMPLSSVAVPGRYAAKGSLNPRMNRVGFGSGANDAGCFVPANTQPTGPHIRPHPRRINMICGDGLFKRLLSSVLLMNVTGENSCRALGRGMMPAAVLLVCAIIAPLHAAERDSLSIGITQFPATLNPNIDVMAAKSYVLGLSLRPFTAYDADWKLTCLLCTELPSISNGLAVPVDLPGGKKGIDLTYTIRADAKWADGAPVTTEDVRFTYDVGRNPQSGVSNAELYRRISGIDIKDARTFTMHVDKLTFDYAAIQDLMLLPAHIERDAFADPAQYRLRTHYNTDPTNPGLYNGPYRIAEFVAGSHILLEPNVHWAGPPGRFRRITVRAIENTAALEANLLSGTIDMIAGELGLPLDEGLAFAKRHGGAFQIVYKPGLVYEHIDLNLAQLILADRRVREALILGLDRAAVSQSLFAGRPPVADSFMNPPDLGYTADIPRYGHDPVRADALLEAAGWAKGADGLRRNAQGQKLSFELMTTAGNR